MKHFKMKKFLLIFIFISSFGTLNAQTASIPADTDTIKYLIELVSESIKQVKLIRDTQSYLVKQNHELKYKNWHRDSIEYKKSYDLITHAIVWGKYIENGSKEIDREIETTKNIIKIASFQNITNSDFENIIIEEASKMLDLGKNNSVVENWKNSVKKIISNPLFKSVMNSNPISTSVLSIINLASGLQEQNIKREGSVMNYDYKIETKDLIKKEKIDSFSKKMGFYIDFYEKLNKINNDFENSLTKIQSKYKIENDSSKNFDQKLGEDLKSNSNSVNKINDLNELFKFDRQKPYSIDSDLDFYRKILDQPKVKTVIETASKYQVLKNNYDNFNLEYRSEVRTFFQKYSDLISSEGDDLKIFNKNEINKILSTIDEGKKRN
jgi:hypothetical protein